MIYPDYNRTTVDARRQGRGGVCKHSMQDWYREAAPDAPDNKFLPEHPDAPVGMPKAHLRCNECNEELGLDERSYT